MWDDIIWNGRIAYFQFGQLTGQMNDLLKKIDSGQRDILLKSVQEPGTRSPCVLVERPRDSKGRFVRKIFCAYENEMGEMKNSKSHH